MQQTSSGVQVVELNRAGITELFVTAPAISGQSAKDIFRRLDESLQARPAAKIVRESVFGLVDCACGTTELSKYTPRKAVWPVTQVAEAGAHPNATAGVHVHAIIDGPIQQVRLGRKVVGTLFEDQYAKYCQLGNIAPDNPQASREDQAKRTLEMIEEAVGTVGMKFTDVIRTWFYNDHILEWYGPFNRVRDTFFKQRKVYDCIVPASTGVGGRNPNGTALVADALAIVPKDKRVKIQMVPSPLQCPAPEYGSSFSRAVELATPDHRRLWVSGTASIAPAGETMHLNDVDAQIDLTMRVVEAILVSRKMSWADVNRAIAYVKYAKDAPSFTNYCAAKKLPTMPVVLSEHDICRDDLLFEIELDAIQACS